MIKKYYIKTFGCQMNYSDSERITAVLEKLGFDPALEKKMADLVVFNTCGVRQSAENRAYGLIHNLKSKGKSSKAKVVVTGCLADRKDVQKRLKEKIDLFFQIKDINKFENWVIGNFLEIRNLKLGIEAQKGGLLTQENISYLTINPKHDNLFQAFVPVMTGCDNFCSYCVVPYARGREVSRPATEVVAEVKKLIRQGYKFITLLGQNVNSYRDGNTDFPKLVKRINALPGNFWLSFLTSHPKDMSDELIEAVAQLKKVIEFVHFPIQAGDDAILKKMNRKYAAKHYLGLVRKMKAAFAKYKPGQPFAIAGDIIVGFPGETRKQFLESAKVMEKVGYDMVYFGQFSPRPGTAAAKLKDNVSHAEKERREKYLNEILKKSALKNSQAYLGKTVDVLVESEKNGLDFGRTRTLKNVKFSAIKKNLVGRIVGVKIIGANTWSLEGEVS